MDWFEEIRTRVVPAAVDVSLTAPTVVTCLVAALVVSVVGPLWKAFRIAVTLVHELGHAVVGMLVGRRFTGFVLRGDMSGHAVTVGRPRGFGRAVSTWAGYPAPAILGAAMVWLAGRGWAAAVVTGVIVVLLVALIRVRSALTLLVMLVALGATAALWWWRDEMLQAQVLVGVGIFLVVGAWRHLGAVAGASGPESDPGVMASLTHLPRMFWNLTFAAVCAAASWVVAQEVLTALR